MSHIDNIIIQVRAELNKNSIKLWLEPYYIEEIGTIDSEMEGLARKFCGELHIRYDYCLAAINELQSNALEKLNARKEFLETGMATLKIRTIRQGNSANLFTMKIPLNSPGKELQQNIANELKIDSDSVKLISSGKVIDPEKPLLEQNINNNQQLMAVIIENASANQDESKMYDRVKKAKADAALLATCDKDSFMQLEDQDGNIIHMPPNERKALTLALALHEKGRAALKRECHNEALVLFLEADQEFASCNAGILESVDNYALLNLDIVWCYLCLKSLTHLPDAERRLFICEENFRRTYGDNMDRVRAVKGNTENERGLLMRLHLLQAVLMFHQNQRDQAKGLFMLAEAELRGLKVDENSVSTLVEMGYSATEARTALRACNQDMDRAVTHILERRDAKRRARQKGKEEMNLNKDPSKEGDEWVNPRSLHNLVGMGFKQELASVALKKSKNDLQVAIDMLQHNADTLALEVSNKVKAEDGLIEEISKIGFDREIVRMALEQALNNSEGAIEILLKLQSEGNYEEILSSLLENIPSTSAGALESEGDAVKRREKAVQALKKAAAEADNFKQRLEAYNRFSEDVSNDDEEYLNLTLVREENILLEYKRILQ